jgi:hypothetical protein
MPPASKRPTRKLYGFPIVDEYDEQLAKRIDSVVEHLKEAKPRLRPSRAVLIRMCVEQSIGMFEQNPLRYEKFLSASPTSAVDELRAQRERSKGQE